MTGCARSEGYYKIDMREKVKYLPHHRMKNTTTPAQQKKVHILYNTIHLQYPVLISVCVFFFAQNKSSGRVNRANQRKLASLFSAGDVSSDLAKYNQLKVNYHETDKISEYTLCSSLVHLNTSIVCCM